MTCPLTILTVVGLLTLASPLTFAVTTLDTVSFNVSWGNGTVDSLQFPWQPSSECLYKVNDASLTCMQAHSASDVVNVWRKTPESLRYVGVNCLRQTYDPYHHGACFCATTSGGQNSPYSFCRLHELELGTFNSTNKLEVLDLSGNIIDSIGPRAFYGLSQLKFLSLRGAPVDHIPYGIFCDTSNLQFLDLSGMALTILPSHSFRCENNVTLDIRVLNLNDNKIRDLPRDSFQFLRRLVSLDLGHNGLVQLHDASFVGADALKYLNLSNNQLTGLVTNVCTVIPSLTILHAHQNKLTTFDLNDLRDCGFLASLDLSYNAISTVQGDTTGLDGLQVLNISNNRVNEFSASLSNLTSLLSLDLSLNLITDLKDDHFKGLGKLTYLNISYNKLDSSNNFTALFEPLSALIDLDLHHNAFTVLNASSFYRLHDLKRLFLANGALRTLRSGALDGLSNLQELDLSFNFIDSIPDRLFDQLTSLEVLRMSQNKITLMESITLPSLRMLTLNHNALVQFPELTNLTRLESLNMSQNNIDLLPVSAVVGNQGLQILDLSYNSLKTFSSDFISSFPSLRELSFQSNRLNMPITVDTFRGIDNLTNIDLSNNFLKIKSFIFDGESLRNLQYLNISKNPLGSLPPSFIPGNATQHALKQLDLYYCNIKEVDSRTFQGLESLGTVDLSYNNIATFQPFFVGYDTRPTFQMKGNPLLCDCTMSWIRDTQLASNYKLPKCRAYTLDDAHAPIELDPSQFLCKENQGCDASCECYKPNKTGDITLVVCRNSLTSAPATVPPSTIALFLDGNAFTSATALMPLTYLHMMETKELYLNRSQISMVNEMVLAEFDKLEILELSDNYLASLPGRTFARQAALRQLYLRNNKLTRLEEGLFDGLQQLEELDISGNRLTTIQQPVLKRLLALNLKYYFFSKNPWVCDCNSLDLKVFLDEVKPAIRDRRRLYCDWKIMLDLPKSAFRCSVEAHGGSVAALAVGVMLGIVSFLILLVALVYFRRELCAVTYAKTGFHIPGRHTFLSKPFDAYVSFDPTDKACSEYVELALLPRLRKEKFNLQTSAEIISDIEVTKKAMEDSKCSVFVVSTNFTTTPFYVKTFNIAADYCKIEKRYKVILVILNDIDISVMETDIMKRLRKGDYITARARLWWERLMYELPVPHPDGLRNNVDDGSDSEVVVFSSINEDSYNSF